MRRSLYTYDDDDYKKQVFPLNSYHRWQRTRLVMGSGRCVNYRHHQYRHIASRQIVMKIFLIDFFSLRNPVVYLSIFMASYSPSAIPSTPRRPSPSSRHINRVVCVGEAIRFYVYFLSILFGIFSLFQSIVYLRSSNRHSLYHPHYSIPITHAIRL